MLFSLSAACSRVTGTGLRGTPDGVLSGAGSRREPCVGASLWAAANEEVGWTRVVVASTQVVRARDIVTLAHERRTAGAGLKPRASATGANVLWHCSSSLVAAARAASACFSAFSSSAICLSAAAMAAVALSTLARRVEREQSGCAEGA